MFYAVSLLDKALSELEKILGSSNEDGRFNYIYPVTTENIAGYTKYINNFSTVLSVAGSGDQLFNCIYHGAKEITLFDINPITYYLIKLKMAMFTKLRREYIDFFITSNVDWEKESPMFFAESTYLSIRDLLDKDTRTFWDTFYKWLKEHNLTPQKSELFRHIRYDRRVILEANDYLATDANYKATSDNIIFANIKFLDCGLVDLPNRLEEGSKFNTILFSNLSDYVTKAFGIADGSEALDRYNIFVNDMIRCYLTLGGQIFFAYIYEASTGPCWTEIDKIDNHHKHFNNYYLKTFPAMSRERLNNHSIVDCVLIKEYYIF